LAVVVGVIASAAGVAAALLYLQSEPLVASAAAARSDQSLAVLEGPSATSAATPPAPAQLASAKAEKARNAQAASKKPVSSKAKLKAKAPRASAKRVKATPPRSTSKKPAAPTAKK
jgi:hypothetical protein